MVLYILAAYHVHDEEIEAVHLPLSFVTILEVLVVSSPCILPLVLWLMSQSRVKSDSARLNCGSSTETLALLHEMSKHLRISHLKEWPRLGNEESEATQTQSAYALACTVYGSDYLPQITIEREPTSPLVTVFDNLIKLTMYSDKAVARDITKSVAYQGTFDQSLVLLRKLAQQLQTSGEQSTLVPWKPDEWLDTVVQCVQRQVFVSVIHGTNKPTVTGIDYSIYGARQRHFNCHCTAPNLSLGAKAFDRQEDHSVCLGNSGTLLFDY